MVEPIDAQNMVARTPLVEKTVAAHRENAPQQQAHAMELQRDRLHEGETVRRTEDEARIETQKERERKKNRQSKEAAAVAGSDHVERVSEPADEPDHTLDVNV